MTPTDYPYPRPDINVHRDYAFSYEGADDETEYEIPTFPWKPAPSFDADRLATGEHPF